MLTLTQSHYDRIHARVKQIRDAYPDSFIQDWQLYDMVATIESGHALHLFYRDNTIICDGWNGSRSYNTDDTPDPYTAYGGYYRTEPGQWYGYSTRLIEYCFENTPDLVDQQLERVCIAYGIALQIDPSLTSITQNA